MHFLVLSSNHIIQMHSHTHLLTSWSRILLEKLAGFQQVKKFPAFYGTRRFITAFTSARHLSLSYASLIQSIPPHPTSWRPILISSHLRLGLPSGLFPSGFPTKTLCTPLPSSIHATCPAHLILLDFISSPILGEQYRSLSSSLRNFLYFPVIPSLLGPNILLSTLFSNTLSLTHFIFGIENWEKTRLSSDGFPYTSIMSHTYLIDSTSCTEFLSWVILFE